MVKVLITYEQSGVVRRAFHSRGILAFSCDLEKARDGETAFHIKGDALTAIKSRDWDLVVAHPPCTYLCNSGVMKIVLVKFDFKFKTL